jgi:hypothetical protein
MGFRLVTVFIEHFADHYHTPANFLGHPAWKSGFGNVKFGQRRRRDVMKASVVPLFSDATYWIQNGRRQCRERPL